VIRSRFIDNFRRPTEFSKTLAGAFRRTFVVRQLFPLEPSDTLQASRLGNFFRALAAILFWSLLISAVSIACELWQLEQIVRSGMMRRCRFGLGAVA
jgi:hypothetical protein